MMNVPILPGNQNYQQSEIQQQVVNQQIIVQQQPVVIQQTTQINQIHVYQNQTGFQEIMTPSVNVINGTCCECFKNYLFGFYCPESCPRVYRLVQSNAETGANTNDKLYNVKVIEDNCCKRCCLSCWASQNIRVYNERNKVEVVDNKRELICFGLHDTLLCCILSPLVKCCKGGPNYYDMKSNQFTQEKGTCSQFLDCNKQIYMKNYKLGDHVCPCSGDPTMFLQTSAIVPITDLHDNEKGKVLIVSKKIFPHYCLYITFCAIPNLCCNPYKEITQQIIFPKDATAEDRLQIALGYLQWNGQFSI